MTENISSRESVTKMRYNISFVFPMFNEAENIENTLVRIESLAREICGDYEVVIVDDASTDGCADIVQKIASRDAHIKLIRLNRNAKFGGALKIGLKSASKDIIVYTDADFPAKEEDIKKALALLDGVDIVTAYSLVLKDASFKRIMMSKVYNFLVKILFGLKLRDINSGLKVFKKEVFAGQDLKSTSPFVDVEIFAEALKKGFKIRQFGLIFELRTKGTSTVSRISVVAQTFLDMFKYKFSR